MVAVLLVTILVPAVMAEVPLPPPRPREQGPVPSPPPGPAQPAPAKTLSAASPVDEECLANLQKLGLDVKAAKHATGTGNRVRDRKACPASVTPPQRRTGARHSIPGSTDCRLPLRRAVRAVGGRPWLWCWSEGSSGRNSKRCAADPVSSVASATAPRPESRVLTRLGLPWTSQASSLHQATVC